MKRFALAFLFSGISTLAAAAPPPPSAARAPSGSFSLEDLGIGSLLTKDWALSAEPGGSSTGAEGQSVLFKNAMAIWPRQAHLMLGGGGVGASYSFSFGSR
jgi:hypothetical protein